MQHLGHRTELWSVSELNANVIKSTCWYPFVQRGDLCVNCTPHWGSWYHTVFAEAQWLVLSVWPLCLPHLFSVAANAKKSKSKTKPKKHWEMWVALLYQSECINALFSEDTSDAGQASNPPAGDCLTDRGLHLWPVPPRAAIIELQKKENEKNEVMTESCPRRLSLDFKWSRLKGRVH